MKTRKFVAILLVVVLLLSVAVSMGQAQGPGVEPVNEVSVELEQGLLDDAIPIQGRLTDSHGNPLNGTYSIKFSLYKTSTGGTAVCSDTDSVHVSNGLFTAGIDFCTASDISGDQLYLGIKVGSDPEMTPRKAIYAVPYAHSLRPGAKIEYNSNGSVLNVFNQGNGRGINAYSKGHDAVYGHSSSGSHAGVSGENTGGGIGVYGASNSGPALSLGGTGIVKSSARSYIWISGNAFAKNRSSDSTRWDMQPNGSAKIWRGSASGSKFIYIPITLPSVLYGQPVKVKYVTIYYKCQDGSKGYITSTFLYKQTDADSQAPLVASGTDHTSNTASHYTLNVDQSLSSTQGILGLYLDLSFSDDSHYVQIGGVRVTLEHD